MTAEGEAVGGVRREPEDKHKKEQGTVMTTGNLFHCLNTVPHIMGHMFSIGKQSLVRILFYSSYYLFGCAWS